MWVKLIVITACVLVIVSYGLNLVSSSEEPPSSKRVRTMEDEGVEQLQTTAVNLVEATTTGEAGQEHTYMCYGVHTHVP